MSSRSLIFDSETLHVPLMKLRFNQAISYEQITSEQLTTLFNPRSGTTGQNFFSSGGKKTLGTKKSSKGLMPTSPNSSSKPLDQRKAQLVRDIVQGYIESGQQIVIEDLTIVLVHIKQQIIRVPRLPPGP